jgi:hypothetical protein
MELTRNASAFSTSLAGDEFMRLRDEEPLQVLEF